MKNYLYDKFKEKMLADWLGRQQQKHNEGDISNLGFVTFPKDSSIGSVDSYKIRKMGK